MAHTHKSYRPETEVVHGIDRLADDPLDLAPPLHLTSTYRFENADHGKGVFDGSRSGYVYTRIANQTIDRFQQKLARLEGGEDAVATASGMAAAASVALAFTRPGDNFIACSTLYGGTFALFDKHLRDKDVEARFLPPAEAGRVDRLTSLVDRRTRMMYIETPANPTLDVIDIGLWAGIAERNGFPLVVDNTFATPYLQRPLDLGAHMVVHSVTKYLGGHADLVAGAIVGSRDHMDQIRREVLHHYGPIASPFNAWMALRGMKTLAVRMERHCDNAMQVAEFLEVHPKIDRVYYPGLSSHPAHDLASRQMRGFGGMVAFEVRGGTAAGKALLDGVRLCSLAVSLGDCDSLIQHPAAMTHSTYSPEARRKAGISDGLIRLSVGIEHGDDIVADLDQALAAV